MPTNKKKKKQDEKEKKEKSLLEKLLVPLPRTQRTSGNLNQDKLLGQLESLEVPKRDTEDKKRKKVAIR